MDFRPGNWVFIELKSPNPACQIEFTETGTFPSQNQFSWQDVTLRKDVPEGKERNLFLVRVKVIIQHWRKQEQLNGVLHWCQVSKMGEEGRKEGHWTTD